MYYLNIASRPGFAAVPQRRRACVLCALLLSVFFLAAEGRRLQAAEYVVIITVDGLRSSIFSELTPAQLPNFARLRSEGVSTLNARTEHDWTYTNPNHVSILTARPVYGTAGHKYTSVSSPPAGQTLHTVAGFYLPSIFDVTHDRGKRTGAFISKPTQFSIIDLSYNATNGAADLIGEDNGRDKIDQYVGINYPANAVTAQFVAALNTQPFHLSWLHLGDPDGQGHSFGWASANYRNAVIAVDGYIGSVLGAIESNVILRGKTAVIVTTDHGGTGTGHDAFANAANYTIPFFVWGSGVDRGRDLYFINNLSRRDPSASRVAYGGTAGLQPIRNADAGNLALKLLELPPVSEASNSINLAQDLRVVLPPFTISSIEPSAGGLRLSWNSLGEGYGYTVQIRSDLEKADWINATGTWPITTTTWLDEQSDSGTRFYRILATALPPQSAAAGLRTLSAEAPTPDRTVSWRPQPKSETSKVKRRRPYSGVLKDDGTTGKPLTIHPR